MKAHESIENYLETIFILGQDGNRVRSIDIVNELEYSRPSVSVAMRNLRQKGYVEITADGYISLTDDGRRIAESMYDRHMLFSDWLVYLGVDKKTAANDACSMEHAMSEQSFLAIKGHIENWKHSMQEGVNDAENKQ